MITKKIWFTGVSVILLASGSFLLLSKKNFPPQAIVLQAGKSLMEAHLVNGREYGVHAYREAEMYYDSAMMEWKRQNEKLLPFRNYSKVTAYANTSIRYSVKASGIASETITLNKVSLKQRMNAAEDRINAFHNIFNGFSMPVDHLIRVNKAQVLLVESRYAYEHGSYPACLTKIGEVEKLIDPLYTVYRKRLTEYFDGFPWWESIVHETLTHSRKSHTTVVIVDKMARVLTVYKNGRIINQYPVELGINWIGDKIQQGDKTTPEGIYKVISQKQGIHTNYYKALLLNYPNEDDESRFVRNRKHGLVEEGASIGNLIEIHGSGGKGVDWTDGCIALKNSDMDEVFQLCPPGTWVTIVGSVKNPYDQLNKIS